MVRGLIPKMLYIVFILCFSDLCKGEYNVPDKWQLIAEAQDGMITEVAIRDGWVVWFKERLDQTSIGYHVMSYYVGLYRKNLSSGEVETLRPPVNAISVGHHFVLGTNGIVSYNYRSYYQQTLYVPGVSSPILLHDETGVGKYTPFEIYEDALMCRSVKHTVIGLALIPFDGKQVHLDQAVTIAKPEDTNRVEYRGGLCRKNRYVLYAERRTVVNPEANITNRVIFEHWIHLFDCEGKRILWGIRNKGPGSLHPLELDEGYAVYCSQHAEYESVTIDKYPTRALVNRPVNALLRYPVDGDGKTQQLELPVGVSNLIDYEKWRLLGILKEGDKTFVGLLDLKSGILTRYAIELPEPRIVNGRSYLKIRSGPKKKNKTVGRLGYYESIHVAFTGEAEHGQVVAVANNKIYAVPELSREKLANWSLTWKALQEDTIETKRYSDESIQ